MFAFSLIVRANVVNYFRCCVLKVCLHVVWWSLISLI